MTSTRRTGTRRSRLSCLGVAHIEQIGCWRTEEKERGSRCQGHQVYSGRKTGREDGERRKKQNEKERQGYERPSALSAILI